VTPSDGQICLELYDSILQRLEDHGPPVTPAEHTEIAHQLSVCHEEGALTQQQYSTALRWLSEINEQVRRTRAPRSRPRSDSDQHQYQA
jgi:hypothetical protein